MRVSEALFAFGWFAGLLLLLLGCWSLHRHLRTASTVWLLGSIAGLPLWYFGSPLVVRMVVEHARATDSYGTWDWLLVGVTMFLPMCLVFIASLSFWLAVRSIQARANKSFTPTPLRGTA